MSTPDEQAESAGTEHEAQHWEHAVGDPTPPEDTSMRGLSYVFPQLDDGKDTDTGDGTG